MQRPSVWTEKAILEAELLQGLSLSTPLQQRGPLTSTHTHTLSLQDVELDIDGLQHSYTGGE